VLALMSEHLKQEIIRFLLEAGCIASRKLVQKVEFELVLNAVHDSHSLWVERHQTRWNLLKTRLYKIPEILH